MGDDLTPRERDILALLAEGLSNKQIARRLGIAHSTVKNTLSGKDSGPGIYRKLGVGSRVEAALLARDALSKEGDDEEAGDDEADAQTPTRACPLLFVWHANCASGRAA